MTAPEQPQPYPGDLIEPLPGLVHYRREYRDILGRPMRGKATITGQARTEAGGAVIVPATVAVGLINGVLEADLPPDTYTIAAALHTADGKRASDTETVTLP